jgi:hypothetical protein
VKAAEALIAWTPAKDWYADRPTSGQVKVGPLLRRESEPDWTAPYAMSGGAAYTVRRDMPEWQQIAMVFIEFHTLVVRDGIDPKVAHEAFLAIDEYRQRISPDIAGAEDIPAEGAAR